MEGLENKETRGQGDQRKKRPSNRRQEEDEIVRRRKRGRGNKRMRNLGRGDKRTVRREDDEILNEQFLRWGTKVPRGDHRPVQEDIGRNLSVQESLVQGRRQKDEETSVQWDKRTKRPESKEQKEKETRAKCKDTKGWEERSATWTKWRRDQKDEKTEKKGRGDKSVEKRKRRPESKETKRGDQCPRNKETKERAGLRWGKKEEGEQIRVQGNKRTRRPVVPGDTWREEQKMRKPAYNETKGRGDQSIWRQKDEKIRLEGNKRTRRPEFNETKGRGGATRVQGD
jgi:hypothetical protein